MSKTAFENDSAFNIRLESKKLFAGLGPELKISIKMLRYKSGNY